MGFSCGIVGLPNVGKSTLFNALTRAGVDASNYPFCTIDPNVGIVPVPDERLENIARIINQSNAVSPVVKFIDIAGLVKGASKGEGLGNQFLSHIREVEAIFHIVRVFEDPNTSHIGEIDPVRDLEIISTELALKDLETLDKSKSKLEKALKGDKNLKKEIEFISNLENKLNNNAGEILHFSSQNDDEMAWLKSYNLLSFKPAIIIANIDEASVANLSENKNYTALKTFAHKSNVELISICAKLEDEIHELDESEASEYLETVGLTEPALSRVIKAGYSLLNLITFYTFNEKECRGWAVPKGTKAPQCAGKIHTDFEKGFIKADILSYKEFYETKSFANAREHGKLKVEGKDYIVNDGDIILFKFH